jgi:hypothetical protein
MTEEKKGFGRNQKIAIAFVSVPYAMNFGLVLAGKLDGSAFWAGTPAYVSLALGIVLGAAAFVKSKWGKPNE